MSSLEDPSTPVESDESGPSLAGGADQHGSVTGGKEAVTPDGIANADSDAAKEHLLAPPPPTINLPAVPALPPFDRLRDPGDVERDLREWVSDSDVTDHGALETMSEVLSGKRPYEAVPYPSDYGTMFPPTPVSARPNQTLTRLVAGIRNLLVFVPVALTWFAVMDAALAFRTDAPAGATFFDVWLTGNGNLDAPWTLVNVARANVWIIGVVIALTVILSGLRARNAASARKKKTDLEARKARIVADFGALVAKHHAEADRRRDTVAAEAFSRAVADAASNANELVRSTSAAIKNIGAVLDTVVANLTTASELLRDDVVVPLSAVTPELSPAADAVRDLAASASAMTGDVSDLKEAVAVLEARTSGLFTDADRHAKATAALVRKLNEDLDTTAAALETTVSNINAAVEHVQLNALMTNRDREAANQLLSTFQTSLASLTTASRDAAQAVAGDGEAASQLLSTFQTALSSLTTASRDAAEAVAGVKQQADVASESLRRVAQNGSGR